MQPVGVVINQDNELLMICKRGKWDLPKGHVDKNETFEECAIREVKEETGLMNLNIIRFLDTTKHEYYDDYLEEDAIKETYWFEMQSNKNEHFIPQMEENIKEIKWIPQNEIQKYLENSYDNICKIIKYSIEL